MTTRGLALERPALSTLVLDQASSLDVPSWLRVALWCWARADRYGHARAYPGQLRSDLEIPTAAMLTKAIAIARGRHLVDACSTSSCLVLPGHVLAPCEGRHR